mmetsp:Transcript_36236/g.71290  ORF Transcript_36236/g.71290 Transcript_36236/m.71290 type:complete len:184 (+) Transcript_36236:143-694(+)
MGCGGSAAKAPTTPETPGMPKVPDAPGVPAAPAMPDLSGIKIPSVNPDKDILAVTGMLEILTGLPQWAKLAENGFEKSDADDSGSVDAKELERTMEVIQKGVIGDLFEDKSAQEVDKDDVAAIVKEFNKDDDSKLDKGEFVAFATEYIKVTISKNFKTLIEKKEDVKPSLEKLTKRVTQLVES